MLHIALFEPQVPPNTGNIIRLVANNGCSLHLIKPFPFDLTEKNLRRAGLDYHDLANVHQYPNYAAFLSSMGTARILAITTKGSQSYEKMTFQIGDVLLFGSETSGLPAIIMDSIPCSHRLRIPMMPNNRSLNLSNAAAIVSYEAWRQLGFLGSGDTGILPKATHRMGAEQKFKD